MNRALAALQSLPDSPDHAGALVCAGRLLMLSGSYDAAERAAVKGLAIYESHGDLAAVARSRLLAGTIASNQGDFERSMRELEASREFYQKLGMRDQLPLVGNIVRLWLISTFRRTFRTPPVFKLTIPIQHYLAIAGRPANPRQK